MSQLRVMVASCDPDALAGVRGRCLLVLGFVLGARRSELAGHAIADAAEAVRRTQSTFHDLLTRARAAGISWEEHAPATGP